MIAILLATRSMQMLPSSEAAQVLINNTSARSLFSMIEDGPVHSVSFSPDGNFIVMGGGNSARVWDAETGVEIFSLVHDDLVYAAIFQCRRKIHHFT